MVVVLGRGEGGREGEPSLQLCILYATHTHKIIYQYIKYIISWEQCVLGLTQQCFLENSLHRSHPYQLTQGLDILTHLFNKPHEYVCSQSSLVSLVEYDHPIALQ